MRISGLLIIFFLCFGISGCSIPGPDPFTGDNNGGTGTGTGKDLGDPASSDLTLLFVGNSLTYTNDLPQLVQDQAFSKGVTIAVTMLAKPNYAIVDHWADGTVQNLIKTRKYDYVIIQQGPSSQSEGRQMLIDGGKDYSDLCKVYGAELCYFMVWPSLRFYSTFDGVIKNYSDAAELNEAILLPVGQVWKDHFDATGNFDYYGLDGFHPSQLGSEVAAEVIAEVLF